MVYQFHLTFPVIIVIGPKHFTHQNKSSPIENVEQKSNVAFREIGKGLCAIEDFCGFMNMPPPMAKSTYHDHLPELHRAYTEVAADSMSNAANKLKLNNNVHVSIDGTWFEVII